MVVRGYFFQYETARLTGSAPGSDAHPPKIFGFEIMNDRSRASVARRASAEADLILADFQIGIVVDHKQISALDLEVFQGLFQSFAGLVHENGRLKENHPAGFKIKEFFLSPPLRFRSPIGEIFKSQVTGIVISVTVVGTGVSQTRHDLNVLRVEFIIHLIYYIESFYT